MGKPFALLTDEAGLRVLSVARMTGMVLQRKKSVYCIDAFEILKKLFVVLGRQKGTGLSMPAAGSWFRNNVTHSVIDFVFLALPASHRHRRSSSSSTRNRPAFPKRKNNLILKKNIFDFVSLTLAPFPGGRHPGVLQARAQQVKRGVAGK